MDLTDSVLPLAERSMGLTGCPAHWLCVDQFGQSDENAGQLVDWVHSAFAIHHFRAPDHVRFLEGVRRRISDHGLLRWFDVFPEANESLDDSSDRSVAQVRQSFGLSVEQRDAVVIHMRKCH